MKKIKTAPINSKESITILKELMKYMGYTKKATNKFIKKHKIGKEKVITK